MSLECHLNESLGLSRFTDVAGNPCAALTDLGGLRAGDASGGRGHDRQHLEEYGWLVALLASQLGVALSGSVVTLDGALDNWFGP